ncbi:MAG: 50S ribosomal protein L18 [Candidatus Omnitrophica bacterium]|nr:50S ribosomal protein L18 [Candidatus Omnitrophota bacterium]
MEEDRRKKRHRALVKRKKIFGTKERPRLTIFRSLKHIYGILINDDEKRVITTISSLSKDFISNKESGAGYNLKGAERVGSLLAQKALLLGIKRVCFDRAGYSFHGRIKAFVEGAKKSGLEV